MACCFATSPPPAAPALRTYSTTFDTAQNPLSEGGAWLNGAINGRDWHNLRAAGGHGIGTDSPQLYSDPIGCVGGTWSPDQTVEVTVYRQFQSVVNARQEIELHLRMQLSPGVCKTYEVLWRAYDAPIDPNDFGKQPNFTIVKWPGPLATNINQFVFIGGQEHAAQWAIRDGDVLRATIDGQNPVRIRAWKNNVLMKTVTDSSASRITTGNPGLGFNYNTGHYTEYGVHGFMATEV